MEFKKPKIILWWVIVIVCGVVGSIYAHLSLGHTRDEDFKKLTFKNYFNEIVKYQNLLVYYKKYISKDIFEEVLNENNTTTSNTTTSNTV